MPRVAGDTDADAVWDLDVFLTWVHAFLLPDGDRL